MSQLQRRWSIGEQRLACLPLPLIPTSLSGPSIWAQYWSGVATRGGGCVLAMVCPVSMLFSGDSFRGSLVVVPWPVSCIILKLYKLCVPSYLVSLCYVICGLSHLLMKVQAGILPTVVLIKKWCKGHDSSKNIAIIHLPIYRYELLLK